MIFRPLYYPQLLHLVNPSGDVGIITLWTPVPTFKRKLAEEAPSILDPSKSRVAVIANLYGDGLYPMFCNLLFNPQLRHLIAIGQDLGLDMPADIMSFLAHGMEDDFVLGRAVKRIRGASRVVPAVPGFDENKLRARLSFHHLGKLSTPGVIQRVQHLLGTLPSASADDTPRIRVAIPADTPGADGQRPSDIAGHQVMRRSPLACWEELMVRVSRFGRRVDLHGGPHLELLNARAVIAEPVEDPVVALESLGFDYRRLRHYQKQILNPELPDGIAYSYGNRLRGFFGLDGATDTLNAVGAALRRNGSTRRGFISLWDNTLDLSEESGERAKPCLTSLLFRTVAQGMMLTAIFRAHDLIAAWLENVYGLMAIQRHVAEVAGVAPGPITVISHSLAIDLRNPHLGLGKALVEEWQHDDDLDRATGKLSMRHDPNGYFIVDVDEGRRKLIVEHRFDGLLVKRYMADRAITIEREIAADMAVSVIPHALWLGRELARAEQLLNR